MRRTNYGTLVNDNEINDNEIALNYIVNTARTMGMKVSDDTAISVKFCADLIKKVKESKLPPCEDAISRQAVDNYITKLLSGYLYDEERTRLEELSAYLWELPPVNPQEPKTESEV